MNDSDPKPDPATPTGAPHPASSHGEPFTLPDRDADVAVEMWSQPRLLAAARAMITNLARRLGFDEMTSSQISLAVDEALCNVINHGYKRRPDGRIWLRAWADEGDPSAISVSIDDRAETVDPRSIAGRDLDDVRPGGLGVHIMREVMDSVIFEQRDGGGMRLIMTRRNDREPEVADAGTEEGGDA